MWIRARFHANSEDFRPIKWPPVGPYWCTGESGDGSYSIIIAYVEREDQIKEFWPESTDIDASEHEEITFTDRFQKPDWWNADTNSAR